MSKIHEDQITLYLLNRLSPKEKELFEQQMQSNTELKKEVEIQKQIGKALLYKRSIEAKAHIKGIVKNWQQYVPELEEAKPSFAQTAQQSMEDFANALSALAQQFFKPHNAAFRNAVVEQLSTEDQAFYHYNRKDYPKAIPLLQKLPKEDQEVQLMIGNALLAQQDYQTAYPYFKQLIDEEAVFFLNDANWYASLCQIGLYRAEEAKKHLLYIINDENTSKAMQQNTQALLHQLTQQL